MTDWAKAMNPTAPLTTEDAALAAAKVSAFGILAGVVNQAISGWYATTPEAQAAAARMVENLTGQPVDPAALAQQSQIGLYMTGGFIVLQLGLAFWQWAKPNIVLPILFLILMIWGLGTGLLALFMPTMGGGQPLWLSLTVVLLMLFGVITQVSGIRGASALSKIRFNAANTYED